MNFNSDTIMRRFSWFTLCFAALAAIGSFVLFALIPTDFPSPSLNPAFSGIYGPGATIAWWGILIIVVDALAIICCLLTLYFNKKTMMFQKLGQIGFAVLAVIVAAFLAINCSLVTDYTYGVDGAVNWMVNVTDAGLAASYSAAGWAVVMVSGVLLLATSGLWFYAIRKEILMK